MLGQYTLHGKVPDPLPTQCKLLVSANSFILEKKMQLLIYATERPIVHFQVGDLAPRQSCTVFRSNLINRSCQV